MRYDGGRPARIDAQTFAIRETYDPFVVDVRQRANSLWLAAREYLREKGYDPDNGARPLARVIQEELKRPLGEELLFGKLEHGGHVVVDREGETKDDHKIVFRFPEPRETNVNLN